MDSDLQADVEDIQGIAAVPTILDVVCRTTGMGFAAVARVTNDRWIACQVLDNVHFGLPAGGELKVETTLCHEISQHRQPIVIDDVAADPTYCSHHTPRLYGLQSYISAPIILSDGRFFGTLCAIDTKPAKLNNPQVIGMFTLFAQLIAHHLEAGERLREARTSLSDELKTAELREQFIAVLGHDLRNPVASVDAGISRLLRDGWTDRSPTVLRLMKASVDRMAGLIDNVMDFTRARLGGGIDLDLGSKQSLEATLSQVVEETRAAHPERSIESTFRFDRSIAVDHGRLAQMLSNLVGNAVSHGSPDKTIRVHGNTADDYFELAVSNGGDPISEPAMDRLFQPFQRGEAKPNVKGLGLGLYIASQIALAHGGRIDVSSDETETRFTFRMPLVGAALRTPDSVGGDRQ